ncbi:MAG: thermitase [Thermoleophilaceae bacterium]|nr:thermitase [Thermoleophilaceae bacterium]
MRIATAALAALTLSIVLAAPAGAATTCTYPPSAYGTGAPTGLPSLTGAPVNDPIFPGQWGLRQIKAPSAWARGDKGAGATIAVVDTGVDLHHPDLEANLTAGTDLTPAATQGCPGPQDENGHGTHVAGIAAAVTNNGIGVAGTAPSARIMPVRVLDASGSGDDPTVIAGIKYAADHGAKVINLSLGGQAIIGETPALNADVAGAAAYAYSKGAVVVAAAGNESVPLCSYPAAADNAICVGATDSRGAPTFYSNFPASPGNSVGVRAPGGLGSIACEDSEDIWSTLWPEGDPCKTAQGGIDGYDTMAGTSMATPFVSGLAAILAGKGLSASQILECIKTTSSNRGSYDPVMGYGIVDADQATRTCSAASTPAFSGGGITGGGGGGGGGTSSSDSLTVTVKRTTLKNLARSRKLVVTIKSGAKVKVTLRALLRPSARSKKTITLVAKRVTLKRAGTRRVVLRISKAKAKAVRRHPKGSVQVRWSAAGQHGIAQVR